jgi:hypothetical protein
MKKTTLLIALLAVLPTFAGRVITYTAVSEKSQEEANNAAMAGVAKQIVAQVDSKQVLTKKESKSGGNSSLDETFFSSNSVKSNIKLKGVKIESVKTDKGYKATATLDMDEFTSDIQFQMKRIRTDVAKLEASAREALKNRQYAKVASDLQSAQAMLPDYERLLWQLSKVYPLNDTQRLLHNLPEVESALIEKLSGIKIKGPTETFALVSSEMPEWSVTVTDSEGPLSGFPLIAKQGRQTLAEKRTSENGSANFLLRKVNFETGPFSLTVMPNLPLAFIKASGLSQGIEITYKVKRSRCEVRLECNQIANLCNAFEKNLNQKSIFAVDDPKAPKLSVGFTASEKNSLGTGNNAMRSYEITLSVKGDGVSYMATSKGVGKSDLDATIKAVQKTDLSDLQKQLTKYCK